MKLVFGTFSGLLIFLFIMIYGGMVMRSVIEEKTSRVIEVIISSVKPVQLMMGKIVGTSLVAVTQVVIWSILGFIFFYNTDSCFWS
jgi:ABC-2 type transport system permease protein